MPKTITINTVQGIGDIFWCYQKLAPYFDVININVLYLEATAVQLRAKAFCHMLPKVGTVGYVKVSTPEYKRVTRTTFSLPAGGVVEYAVNAPLERGINLRDIDPGKAIEEFVDLGLPAHVEPEDYLCAFVSGTQNHLCWKPDLWVNCIRELANRLDTKRIALIGAEWDIIMQDVINAELCGEFTVANHTGAMGLANSVDMIRRAQYFIGFQSGLNVIAENYNVHQLMLYYKHLEPMLYTWCKPGNIRTKFTAATFDDNINNVLTGLTLPVSA